MPRMPPPVRSVVAGMFSRKLKYIACDEVTSVKSAPLVHLVMMVPW